MTRRVLHFCGIAIATGFLATGIEAKTARQQPRGAQLAQAQVPRTTVPDLSGRTEQEARALLEKARLRVGDIIQVETTAKPGTVIKQDRIPGSQIAMGTPVGFALAIPIRIVPEQGTGRGRGRGQTSVSTVPDLSGRTEQEARALLEKARLRVGDVNHVEANIKPGTVIKQDRAPGSQVAVGISVGFALAIPIRIVPEQGTGGGRGERGGSTVPDLSGRTEQEARALLARARLRVGDVTTVEANLKPGTVIKQDRTPGSQVAVRTPVGFALAIPIRIVPGQGTGGGRGPSVSTVPDLSGRTEQEARDLLARARLRVGDVTNVEAKNTPGTVIKQDRAPGSQVAVGTPVGFALAISITAAVPDLSGRTDQEARDLLAKARLSVGDVTKVAADITPGTVVKQDRTPGTLVEIRTPVGFALAIPITVAVPDLSGRTDQEARQLLAKARLSVGSVTRVEADIEQGRVVKQDWTPGTLLEIRTPVGFALAIPITVEVPSLVERTHARAIDLIKAARLAPGAVTPEESRLPVGTVLRQRPVAGTRVAIGTVIDFATATPVTVPVPPLEGRTQEEAMNLLKKYELVPGNVSSQEDRRTAGTVLSQQPPANTRVAIGTAVEIATAVPITVLVPDVLSKSEADARQMLRNVELTPGTITIEESRQSLGSVLRQSVPTGTRVAVGTAVDLVTATPVTVLIPGLVGETEGSARQRLADIELGAGTVEYRESPAAGGSVVVQSIEPDNRVPIGTLVNLVVAVVETVAVPSFVGLSLDAARRTLVANRLEIGSEQRRGTSVESPGTVLAQSSVAGTRVPVGTPIGLTVAMPLVVTVPRLVGLPHDNAAAALAAAGLELGNVALQTSLRAGGTVLSQVTAPGTQVQFGTPVAFAEARPRVVWMGPAGVLFLIGLVGLRRVRITGRKPPAAPPHEAPEPRLEWTPPLHFTVRPRVDVGDAHVQCDEAKAIRCEVRIQLVADAGTQDVCVEKNP